MDGIGFVLMLLLLVLNYKVNHHGSQEQQDGGPDGYP